MNKTQSRKAGQSLRKPLSTGEAAELLGVTPQTVRAWIAQGHIVVLDLPGGLLRIPAHEVERLMTPRGTR